MASLTERLVGKGKRWGMEYEDELVHNTLAVTHNAVVSVASKVKENTLWVINALVIAL